MTQSLDPQPLPKPKEPVLVWRKPDPMPKPDTRGQMWQEDQDRTIGEVGHVMEKPEATENWMPVVLLNGCKYWYPIAALEKVEV